MHAENLSDDERTPRRSLGKQEAIRHLIHAAIRLIMKMEDPFAVHLLVHSADKMLIDLAEKRGQELRVDWKLYIKDEWHKAFFKRYRETYNYLKHAKEDFAADLPVHDIMMLNVMALFICIANYNELFSELRDHIRLFLAFVMMLLPKIIIDTEQTADLLKNIRMTQSMTPREFFEFFEKNAQALPQFHLEAAEDLEDIVDFYDLSFRQLRAGETKSSKIIVRGTAR